MFHSLGHSLLLKVSIPDGTRVTLCCHLTSQLSFFGIYWLISIKCGLRIVKESDISPARYSKLSHFNTADTLILAW